MLLPALTYPTPQVPEFRVSYTITTDAFDALYKRLKPKGVTMTALLAKAAGVALAGQPPAAARRCALCFVGQGPKGETPEMREGALAAAGLVCAA